MDSDHKSLLFHTEVRWLSRGKTLTRILELRDEIIDFLKGKNDLVKHLKMESFYCRLAYLANIFTKLNELNLYLQGLRIYAFFQYMIKSKDL